MAFVLWIVGPLLVSVALGVALNRFALGKMEPGRARAFTLAASRAIFVAPAIEHIGHGIHLPMPVLVALAYSQREFAVKPGFLTFLFPTIVFVASLALARSRRFGLWFSGLVTAHLAVFVALAFLMPSFQARLALFGVNAAPWYPLHHWLKLPVTEYGWLILPNQSGWAWCLVVWLIVYALLAFALARLTLRSSASGKTATSVN
jgi:hypothetical protein